MDEAIACYKKAIELDPKFAVAHYNLGNALAAKGQLDAAIACCKKAIELDPRFAIAHSNLGSAEATRASWTRPSPASRRPSNSTRSSPWPTTTWVLRWCQGPVGRGHRLLQEGHRTRPEVRRRPQQPGHCAVWKGQLDAAIACYRKAIELDPKLAVAHYNLGIALRAKGQVDEAIAAYKKAIELNPKYAEPHCNLGAILATQGRFAESLEAYKRGHELGMKQPGWRYPSADWVREAETRAAMELKLSRVSQRRVSAQ